MAEEPRLERGQEGEWVQYLHQTLEYRGLSAGAPDGQFGEVLENAVMQFQTASGLPADGVVDDATWDALVRGETADAGPDERMTGFDVTHFPLLAELAQYGEDESAVEPFLVARGVDPEFIELMRAHG